MCPGIPLYIWLNITGSAPCAPFNNCCFNLVYTYGHWKGVIAGCCIFCIPGCRCSSASSTGTYSSNVKVSVISAWYFKFTFTVGAAVSICLDFGTILRTVFYLQHMLFCTCCTHISLYYYIFIHSPCHHRG